MAIEAEGSSVRGVALTRRSAMRVGVAGAAACALPTLSCDVANRREAVSDDFLRPIYIDGVLSHASDSEAITDSGILAVRPTDGKHSRIVTGGYQPRVSPGGEEIAFCRDGRLLVQDLRNGKSREIARVDGQPVWSPDGTRIICSQVKPGKCDDTPLRPLRSVRTWQFDILTGGRRRLAVTGTDSVEDLSPDGRWLLTVADRRAPYGVDQEVYLLPTEGGGCRLVHEGGLSTHARFSPEGDRIAFANATGDACRIVVAAANGRNKTIVYERESKGVGGLCFSPSGRHLAAVLFDENADAPVASARRIASGYRIEIFDLSAGGNFTVPLPDPLALGVPSWG